ncbi:hypothetical protein [Phycicoccus sp. Soil748]|uniref:hypothetical protein n=1 Tax=Phycicoccus sp. Soil748 TaxID=1736397 RepID=UPI0007029E9E|nr:hypothetical protein [Phycicoccus sp. Soil748]KRE55632.1 hypothetical protein ASG70_09955 [Phycicoccus sp. Soil748]
MDIFTAIRIMNSRPDLQVKSTRVLAAAVNASAPPGGGGLVPVPALNRLTPLRPADVLLNLAKATAPRYRADVYEAYLKWAKWRYIGVFEPRLHVARPCYRLSEAGRSVAHNQRRVLSEELGIGFSTSVLESHLTRRFGPHAVTQFVDVDVALDDNYVLVNGVPHGVGRRGNNRPDYIAVTTFPGSPGGHLSLLESKGTKSVRHSIEQLAHASLQLNGISVGGAQAERYAISTVMNASAFYANALELELSRDGDGPGDAAEETQPDFIVDDVIGGLDANRDLDVGSEPDIRAERLAGASLLGSWASLADLSENQDAYLRWAPDVLKRRRARSTEDRRPRVTIEMESGLTARGVRSRVSMPGGDLEVFLGVIAEVDDALTRGDARDVLGAQASLASRRLDIGVSLDSDEESYAIGGEGAALALRALRG